MRRILFVLARLGIAAVFLWAAIAKLRDPWMLFAMEIDNMHVVPPSMVELAARTVPWFELALGVALAVGIATRYVAPLTTVFIGVLFSLVVVLYLRGFQGDCGCFGPGEQLGPKTLARDFSFVLLSLWVSWEALRRPFRFISPTGS